MTAVRYTELPQRDAAGNRRIRNSLMDLLRKSETEADEMIRALGTLDLLLRGSGSGAVLTIEPVAGGAANVASVVLHGGRLVCARVDNASVPHIILTAEMAQEHLGTINDARFATAASNAL